MAMIVILVFTTVAIFFWHYFDIVKQQTVVVAHHNQDLASGTAEWLDNLIDENFCLIRALSMHPAVISGKSAEIDRLLAVLLPLFPLRLNIIAADLEGNNIGSAVPDPGGRSLNYLDSEWFRRARSGLEVVGNLHDSELFKRPAVMISAPIRNENGKTVGVIGVPFDLRKLNAVIATSWHTPQQASIVVVDGNGMVLADTEKPANLGSKFSMKLTSCDAGEVDDCHYHWIDGGGGERLVNIAPVDGRGWTVMAAIPLPKARELPLSISRVSLMVSGSAGLMAMILAWWFGRTITREIRELLAGMDEIERGNLAYAMKLSGTAELEHVTESFNDMAKRLQSSEAELRDLDVDLERRVAERINQLEHANRELESFSYSVSHDLNAPLRRIEGYSQVLREDYGTWLDDEGGRLITRIEFTAHQLRDMVNGMLKLSRLSRGDLKRQTVDLSMMAHEILDGLSGCCPERRVSIDITGNLRVDADPILLRVLLENLLGNAWKYTRTREQAEIDVGVLHQDGENVLYVRDNGVGFDLSRADRLFMPFQRMHRVEDFEGDGIGLATAQKIVHRHGGRIWAEAAVGKGATFFFALE